MSRAKNNKQKNGKKGRKLRLLGGIRLRLALGLAALALLSAAALYALCVNQVGRNMESCITRDLLTLQTNTQVYVRQYLLLSERDADEESFRQCAQEIADDLLNIDDLFSSMDHSEQDLFAEMCGLDLSLLEDYSLNDAMMNVKSHTLYIAKVKDAADMDAVKTAFQTRKEQMEQSFERYLEDQYEIAKAGQIVTSGNWVMLVICEDSPKVVDRFNELMGA